MRGILYGILILGAFLGFVGRDGIWRVSFDTKIWQSDCCVILQR